MLRTLTAWALLACLVPAVALADVTGTARVVNGDSLTIKRQELVLFGIDAPEPAQTCHLGNSLWLCGEDAQRHLETLVRGKTVTCKVRGRDDAGRTMAVCFVDAQDINRAMVWAGMALAFRDLTDAYLTAEGEARTAKRGIWASNFIPPWKWRRFAGANK